MKQPSQETTRQEVDIPEAFCLFITCPDERRQRELYERLVAEGWSCRVLTL